MTPEETERIFREIDARIQAERRYYEQRFTDERRISEQHDAHMQMAITKAENAMTNRLEGMNEWRATISDIIARSISQREHEILEDKVNAIAAGAVTRREMAWAVGAVIAAVGATTAVIGLVAG